MKVFIGKPRNTWFGPYHLTGLLKYFGVSEDKCYELGDKLLNTWVDDFLIWLYDHNPMPERVVKVKIDDSDLWDLDYTLAQIIYPALVKMRASDILGIPQVEDSDVPDSLKSMNAPRVKNKYDPDDFYILRWYYVLDEMIFAFSKQIDDSWKFHLDMEIEELQEIQTRVDNGLILFGKYYKALWI